ncbi:MAG TPA: crotonase/enoyl-CoA hydratase family protein [Xanthobacteraceae bacterium]|nr:crotonase/enoyl-CoA hydratase family protein [Xanthobacteraceae bacterium]
MTGHVIVTDDGSIRILRLNRPEKKNALTDAMYETLSEALENAAVSKVIRCIVIAGGAGAFTAGADLQDFLHAAQHKEGLRPQATRFLHRIAHAGKPMVAAVQGVAVGIGTTLLLHCDYVVAAMDARFSTPFVNLGLVPEAGSSLLMPRLMGTRRAFELLVMGHPLDADQAMAVGLVNAVVPAGEVEPEAMKAARQIAALPAEAVAASRRLIRGSTAEIVRRIDEESEIFKQRLKSDEAKAAFEAFLTRKG